MTSKDEIIAELELKIRNEAYNAGLERGKELARADLSPPVPEDVAEAISTVETFIENLNNGEAKIKLFKNNIGIIKMDDYTKLISVLETLIRAASTPSAEFMAAFELGYTAGFQDTIEGNLSGLRHDEYLKALNQPHTGGE